MADSKEALLNHLRSQYLLLNEEFERRAAAAAEQLRQQGVLAEERDKISERIRQLEEAPDAT